MLKKINLEFSKTFENYWKFALKDKSEIFKTFGN